MNANEIVKKYGYQLGIHDDTHLSVGGLVPESVIPEIRAQKAEVILILKDLQMKREAAAKTRQAEIDAEYMMLLGGQLFERKIESGKNPAKRDEFLRQAKNVRFFHGEEDDGLNLHIAATQSELFRKAEAECPHELKTIYMCGISDIGKKMLTRRISCPLCELCVEDVSEEKLTDEESYTILMR